MYLAVAFGLFAGFLFAASASLQQHVAQRTASADRNIADELFSKSVLRPLYDLIRRLIRRPLWVFGWVTNLLGFGVQAVALHFGSVALVQPLLVTQLLFAMPLSTAWARRWPIFIEWFGVIMISAGVAVFVAVREVAPTNGEPHRYRILLAMAIAAGLVFLLVTAAAGRRTLWHATLVSIAAGICFAISAVLIKLTTDDLLHRGVVATALDWPGYCLAISTMTGLILEQGAFATGSLSAAVAAMTITNPLASYLLGVLAFRVKPPTSAGALAALAVSGALLIVGVAALSRSPTVRKTDVVEEDFERESEPQLPTQRTGEQVRANPTSTPDTG